MFYLGPYVWYPTEGPAHWGAPVGADCVVDLRSIPMQSVSGGLPQGHGIFFSAAALPAEYLPLGDPGTVLSVAQKAEFALRLGYLSPMDATTVIEAVWEAMTLKADPTGQDNTPPMIPTTRRRFELHFQGNGRVRDFTPGMPEFGPARALLQNNYRITRSAVIAGDLPISHYRKILGFWRKKYGVEHTVFIPNDLPDEGWLEPTTTITESFDTADGPTLGPDLTWAEDEGTWSIVSNTANASTSGAATARAVSSLSSDDHYSQSVIPSISIGVSTDRAVGVAARKAASATLTYYIAFIRISASPDRWETFKRVAGSFTAIGTNTDIDAVANDVIKIECNGSTITRYRNGSSQNAATDTAIASNLQTGLYAQFTTTGRFDDFEAADLAAAANPKGPLGMPFHGPFGGPLSV